jgi:hypothetical protein
MADSGPIGLETKPAWIPLRIISMCRYAGEETP